MSADTTPQIYIIDSNGTAFEMTGFVDRTESIGKEVSAIEVTPFSGMAEEWITDQELSQVMTISGNYEQSGTLAPDPVLLNLVEATGTVLFDPGGTTVRNRRYLIPFIGKAFAVEGTVRRVVRFNFDMQKTGEVGLTHVSGFDAGFDRGFGYLTVGAGFDEGFSRGFGGLSFGAGFDEGFG